MVEQPHFDDELTVLTAQQVVPLAKVRTRIRKRWFLGGAFAVAMLLGAASAIVSAYFKFRNMPDPEIQPTSFSSVLPVPEPPPETVVIVRHAKPRVRNTDRTEKTDYQPQLSEDEALKQIRDAVLSDDWQERRARRVGRVDRRDRRNAQHHDRNLSNINEIFEGPHHP
jgi:hypothetical protein